MPDRLGPVRGSSIFIWELNDCEGGNLQATLTRCKEAGCRAVLIKAADGTGAFAQWNMATISAVKAAGLAAIGWGYSYGGEATHEARTAAQQIALGADGWVVDAEIEYEAAGHAVASSWAHAYCGGIRAVHPTLLLGLTTFALPTFHPAFPYQAFRDAGCDFWMPQVYWGSWGRQPQVAVEDTVSSITQDGRCRNWPLLPVGQTYQDDARGAIPVDDRAMHAFSMAASHRWGSVGLSWWSMDRIREIPGAWTEVADFPRKHYGL